MLRNIRKTDACEMHQVVLGITRDLLVRQDYMGRIRQLFHLIRLLHIGIQTQLTVSREMEEYMTTCLGGKTFGFFCCFGSFPSLQGKNVYICRKLIEYLYIDLKLFFFTHTQCKKSTTNHTAHIFF